MDGSAAFIVFVDGAAKGNPGPGGWGAIVAADDVEVIELGGAAGHTTNNRMELMAPIEALRCIAERAGAVKIHSDSTYVIRGITAWVWNWRKRDWKTAEGGDVVNRDLWEILVELVSQRGKTKVQWHHVRGHSGIPGNERVDEIATTFALARQPQLYRGPRHGYDVDLHSGISEANSPAPRPKAAARRRSSSSAAYSYLSLVGGELQRHPTWAECERRVKGVRGARFKKASSRTDEESIVRDWGADPAKLP